MTTSERTVGWVGFDPDDPEYVEMRHYLASWRTVMMLAVPGDGALDVEVDDFQAFLHA